MPMASHGFRSGFARATVNGVRMRLHTSRSDQSSYEEHRLDVLQQFAAGQGEPDEDTTP
jgi:hypothetical protein